MTHSPWRQLFGEVERVYGELAGVLREADGLLDRAGYERPAGDNAIAREISASPSKPSWWFPGWVARFYAPRTAGAPTQILYVVAFLHKRAGDDMAPFDEPVLGGGVWRFRNANHTWRPWMAKAWAWGPRPALDGVVVARELKVVDVDAKGRCFGVPLAEVEGPETLKDRLVDPLVELASAPW